ncbi:FAD/NAD-binding domain-containing protein [Mycena albidolilacea]|uniref:FAD/NAD-binding domain-containing protein n=1 Tax=Mycena albidolilacea TaxID=1033008 RepID=A0AAD7F0I0_9AGAR|nr:FAD/NAD-binding domain-containing protein [Mycena albidolilacea]
MNSQPPKAVVVGSGPAGCLSAISLANLGWQVTIFERRRDLRKPTHQNVETGFTETFRQRSINLTLSARGLAAIYAVDGSIVEPLMQQAVPLQGRIVHHSNGKTTKQYYDTGGECLYCIERDLLSAILVERAVSKENIQVHFQHKVESVDFEKNTLRVQNTVSAEGYAVNFDLCIGADGSHSVVRRHLLAATRMEYSQHYMSHEYVQIRVPHGLDGAGNPKSLLPANYLHVWPRGDSSLVAMANENKGFNCALFAPRSVFATMKSPKDLLPWLKSDFPDFVSLLGTKQLLTELQNNPRSQMIITKANPYNKGTVVILGDAAHSIVPFDGQGLNSALEDVRILSILLRRAQEASGDASHFGQNATAISRAFEEYSEGRHGDLVAISELSMNSHYNLRRGFATLSYMIKKHIDNVLYALSAQKNANLTFSDLKENIYGPLPSGWIPLYTMVSFRPDVGYCAARKKAASQERLIERVGMALGLLVVGCASWALSFR